MKPKSAPTALTPVAVEAVSIPETSQAVTITPEIALAFLVSHYGLPSVSLAERALKAAVMVANANSAHGDMRTKMPVIQEIVKDGKATKKEGAFTVKDNEGVTRDASKLTPEQRRAYNALVVTVTAAKHLGILAAKVK